MCLQQHGKILLPQRDEKIFSKYEGHIDQQNVVCAKAVDQPRKTYKTYKNVIFRCNPFSAPSYHIFFPVFMSSCRKHR